MSGDAIRLKYDGGDAERNAIDARLFGQSLQGIDRLVSDAIIIFSLSRSPRRLERAPLILKVREAQAGSYDVPALYQEASQLLAIGIPIISTIGPEVINHYVNAVLDHFKGDDEAVELAIEKMAAMHSATVAAMSLAQQASLTAISDADQRRHEEQLLRDSQMHAERMSMHEVLRAAIAASGPAAVDYVAPVGRSVDTAMFSSGGLRPIVTDVEDADRIRDSQKLDWRPVCEMIIRTDGFKLHSSALSIENPEQDGYLMAEVDDPTFDEGSNPYTLAAQKRATIRVLARCGYKNSKLAKVKILDFISEA